MLLFTKEIEVLLSIIFLIRLDAKARQQGYSFTLIKNGTNPLFPVGGLDFLEELGLFGEIEKFSFIPQGFRFIDGITGT